MMKTPNSQQSDDDAMPTNETVVSVTSNTLTTTCDKGQQHDYTLTKHTKITKDGAPCKLSEISVGTPVRIQTQPSDESQAISIEA